MVEGDEIDGLLVSYRLAQHDVPWFSMAHIFQTSVNRLKLSTEVSNESNPALHCLFAIFQAIKTSGNFSIVVAIPFFLREFSSRPQMCLGDDGAFHCHRLHWSPSHRAGSHPGRFGELFTMILTSTILRVATYATVTFLSQWLKLFLSLHESRNLSQRHLGLIFTNLPLVQVSLFCRFMERASRPNAAEWTPPSPPPPRGRSYAKRGKNPLSNLPNYQIHRQVINPRRDGRQLVGLLMLSRSINVILETEISLRHTYEKWCQKS